MVFRQSAEQEISPLSFGGFDVRIAACPCGARCWWFLVWQVVREWSWRRTLLKARSRFL